MDYVHWLNKNYCIWEGTYLWFKAWTVLLHMEVKESSLGIYFYQNEIYPKTNFLSMDFYTRNYQEFPFPNPLKKKKNQISLK